MQPVVGTVAAANYLPQVRVLAASLRRHHPGLRLQALVLDAPATRGGDQNFDLLRPGDVEGVSAGLHAASSAEERKLACVLAKPLLLRHLLRRCEGLALFLDPDMLILDTLVPALAACGHGAIALCPHFLVPPVGETAAARERAVRLAGSFNAGLVGLRPGPEAMRFLEWWQARISGAGRDAPQEGLYYDQRWLDFVPGVFREAVVVLRDPGLNVGWWNLPERHLRQAGQARWIVGDGEPCRLMHFSGFDPALPGRVTGHDAAGAAMPPDLAPLFAAYAAALLAAGGAAGRFSGLRHWWRRIIGTARPAA